MSGTLDADPSTNSSNVTISTDYPTLAARAGNRAGASFSASQSRAILITALSAACFSLVAVLIALRWFLIMRRSFRHCLVMYLIISDASKAIWYFVFPIVVFVSGPVESSSNFCQASGFFLVVSIAMSDMAILIIALHSILYILRPNNAMGEGGLYRYRNWIYPFWLGLPVLAASLAFIHEKDSYVTAGTFCYLPKRPFWYRLALSWVPRYLIISVILFMYIWIYIYVRIKFRGFDNLAGSDSSSVSESRRESAYPSGNEDVGRKPSTQAAHVRPPPALTSPSFESRKQKASLSPGSGSQHIQPWDEVNFITAKPLQRNLPDNVAEDDTVSLTARGREGSSDIRIPSGDAPVKETPLESSRRGSRKASAVLTTATSSKIQRGGSSDHWATTPVNISDEVSDPLKKTRLAIRKQLRYLFIYPLVYIIMWSFPFASQALSYDEYYVAHPVFWLSVVQTLMLGLQAGVDSILFSWTEKPWRRIDASSRFSLPFIRRQSKALLQRHCPEKSAPSTAEPPSKSQPLVSHSPHWWEAEGRRRNDSVWLGTSTFHTLSPITTRN